mmetsp:Transcript_639/g.1504  ORF Transcript_639/g.1504 Transcript_639/m.1504 type:complete len:217 (+) Transcript_639:1-651(+)
MEVHDVCQCVKTHSGKHHAGMTDELMGELEEASVSTMRTYVAPRGEAATEHLALAIGRVVSAILRGMGRSITDEDEDEERRLSKTRMHCLSGHDTTIMPLLVVLGIPFDKEWPPFMSNIVIELFYCEKLDKHFVRVLYNGAVAKDLKHANRNGFVEYVQFRKDLTRYVSIDHHARCNQVFREDSKDLDGASSSPKAQHQQARNASELGSGDSLGRS